MIWVLRFETDIKYGKFIYHFKSNYGNMNHFEKKHAEVFIAVERILKHLHCKTSLIFSIELTQQGPRLKIIITT